MPCDMHSWWFDAVCPECADIATPVMEDLSIPEFLQRNFDNTMRFPDVQVVGAVAIREGVEPLRAPSPTLADRQEFYRTEHAEQKRQQAQARFAKLKAERKERQHWELTRKRRSRT